MKNFSKTIKQFAAEKGLWKEGNRIMVAVSGGPDSVCLLYVLFSVREKYGLELGVAHVNYGLRGREADEDERYVRKLAEKIGLTVDVLRVKKSSLGSASEEKMRKIRYDFFERLRKKNKFDLIAVGHTSDDQAETVLMRLLRGSGLSGLRAMRPKSGNVIRPLLQITRQEIIFYLRKNKIRYRIDRTNRDVRYFRNKIRHRLIPYLERNFNPSARQSLVNLARSVADDYDYIEKEADNRFAFRKRGRAVAFSASDFGKSHPAIRQAGLRSAIRQIKGDLSGIELAHIKELEKAVLSTKAKHQVVRFQGLKMTRKGDMVSLSV